MPTLVSPDEPAGKHWRRSQANPLTEPGEIDGYAFGAAVLLRSNPS
ncbi:hypothetical protein [Phormidium tenue]|nr:hypothetical protein [Phormidium tenue]MBD2231918.1 hypothetical protein [Phormidium tenue FACHB-1052]